jgi:hypothetical protein
MVMMHSEGGRVDGGGMIVSRACGRGWRRRTPRPGLRRRHALRPGTRPWHAPGLGSRMAGGGGRTVSRAIALGSNKKLLCVAREGARPLDKLDF